MSTTTRKRRNDIKLARRCNKKRKIDYYYEEDKSFFDAIPDEVKMLILAQVPFDEFSQLRLVCSTWNKLTRSSVFGKLTCIMKYGNNAAPLRISNLSSPDADLFIIPTRLQDSKLMVDWFEYVKLRSLRDEVIKKWENLGTYISIRRFLKTDLSLQNIEDFVQFYIENIFNCFTCNSTEAFLVFALKLVPHLLRYEQIDLLCALIEAFLYSEEEEYEFEYRPDGFLRCRIYLDLLEVAPTYFPYDTIDIYKAAVSSSSDVYCSLSSDRYLSLSGRVLVAMIKQGATGTLEDVPSFEEHFKQPFEDCYQVLRSGDGIKFLNTMLSICTEEFNNSNDWRVQLSAVTASQAIPSNMMGMSINDYLRCQIDFALSILDRPNLHPEVRRAATFILFDKMSYYRNRSHSRTTPPSRQMLHHIFRHFVDAVVYLDKNNRIDALHAITHMLENSYKNESIEHDMIERLNAHAIEFFSTVDPTNDMSCKQLVSICDSMEVICSKLGIRIGPYLQQYHNALLNIIKDPNNTLPEFWLALYFDIETTQCPYMVKPCDFGVVCNERPTFLSLLQKIRFCCLISDFDNKAKQIIAQVEQGLYAQVPIRKAVFYACCQHAQQYAPCSDDEYIEHVLSVFPQIVLEGFDVPTMHDRMQQNVTVNRRELEAKVTSKITDNDYEGPPTPIETSPPSYVPYSGQQWMNAIYKASKMRQSTVKNQLVKFKKPIDQVTMSSEDDFDTLNIVKGYQLTKMLDAAELKLATKIIGKWIDMRIGRKYSQKFLHILLAYLMSTRWEDFRAAHLRHAISLLRDVSLDLHEYYLGRYCSMIAKALTTGYTCIFATVLGEFMLILEKVCHVEPDLLVTLVKISTSYWDCRSLKNKFSELSRPFNLCEMIIKKWPRAAWKALTHGELLRVPFFNSFSDNKPVQLWQIKLFGMRRIANLHCANTREYSKLAILDLCHMEKLERYSKDNAVLTAIAKMKLYCELCIIDPDIGEVNYFNQFLFDQHKLKNALIKANKYPGEMKYYSELLF